MGARLVQRNCQIAVERLDPTLDGLRILHLSDLHAEGFTPALAELGERLRGVAFDLMAITGDLCMSPYHWRRTCRALDRLLEGIKPPLGVWVVLGNHDPGRFADGLTAPGIRVLRNAGEVIEHRGAAFNLAGIDHSRGRHAADIAKALTGCRDGLATVLLAHYPSTVYTVPSERVDVVLAGHTHGGQIRLPLLGCIYTNDWIAGRYARGLHRIGGVWLHVSAGIGVGQWFPYRFRCPPEFSVVTLRSAGAQDTAISS